MHRNIFTFLIFLAFSTLLAQSLEITDFQRVDSDLSARVTAPKMDNYGKPMALLKISTALTGVSVTGTGYCEVEAHTGELWVYVSEGTFNIKVAVAGYERLVYPLPETAKSATVYRMKLRGEKVADQIPVMFDTDPSGAEIFIDDISLGRTQNGKLSTTAGAGNHKIKVKLDGFETVEEEQDIRIGNQAFDYKLVEAMDATVTIESDPEGAQVHIKNVFFGETPATGFFPEGTFDIRIEKDCYRTIEERITITDPTVKRYTLTDIRATLTINTHPNATVYVNDDAGHKGGVKDLKLKPQMANIRVEMPKAETIARSALLEEAQTVTKDLYPEVQTGIVMINVIPADATIELTGDAGEHYTSTGKNTFRDVPIGTYELKVAAEGCKTHKETLTLTADETVRKQVKLEEGSDCFVEMVFVQGGTFRMGSFDGDKDEKPPHYVVLSSFYLGKYEITQAQWKEVMGNNPSKWKDVKLPVESISWFDAVEFCNKLSKKEGLTPCYTGSGDKIQCNFIANGYRLPTEAEWEYAARGGMRSKGYKFSGGNNLVSVGWFYGHSGHSTRAVGEREANELDIHDMSGNVWEWCWDWYGNYIKENQINPKGCESGLSRVYRGGSWSFDVNKCRVTSRGSNRPEYISYGSGFRLCRNAE